MYEPDHLDLHVQQDLRDDRPAPRICRRAGRDAARADEEGALLYREQRLVGRAVRRDRRARGIAGLSRRVPRRAEGAPGSVLRGHSRACAAGVLSGKPPAGAFYAFLRINPELAAARRRARRVAVVGDDGVS